MKILRMVAVAAAAGCSSLTAGTLTVTGNLSGVTYSNEGTDLVLVTPSSADLRMVPESVGFAAVDSNDPKVRRYRVHFDRAPSYDVGEKKLVFSDGAAGNNAPLPADQGGAKTDTARTPDTKKTDTAEAPKPTAAKIGDLIVQLPTEGTLAKRKFSADTAVPESPAAAAIGSTATLVRLNDASDATTQVLHFVDGDGNLRSGFSFAMRPYRVYVQPTLTDYLYGSNAQSPQGDDFRGGRLVRFMSRLDFSLAATVDEAKGTNKRGASLALGLSGYIFNNADSRFLFSQELVKNAKKKPYMAPDGAVRPTRRGVVAEEVDSAETQAVADRVFASVWNNSYWAFGGAPRWRSTTGKSSDFTYDGAATWTTLAWGFEGAAEKLKLDFLEDKSQLLLHTSYRNRQEVADPSDATKKIREDLWTAAAQLRIGGNNFNVFGEYVWSQHSPVGRKKYSSRTYFAGFERKLTDDLWLQLSVGSEKNDATKDTSALLRTALNYAFGQSLKLGAP